MLPLSLSPLSPRCHLPSITLPPLPLLKCLLCLFLKGGMNQPSLHAVVAIISLHTPIWEDGENTGRKGGKERERIWGERKEENEAYDNFLSSSSFPAGEERSGL
ncbi:hypothetical protein E2C01_060129 [Portunus trituberculatus]|uniref:Uncharacterized protein n=1 Tax=Portunus trituberculatus TaxID=210409 RepID=A0A5B7H7V9_PORTR|nr:hypothetical protein [Portunus trituberculatus]